MAESVVEEAVVSANNVGMNDQDVDVVEKVAESVVEEAVAAATGVDEKVVVTVAELQDMFGDSQSDVVAMDEHNNVAVQPSAALVGVVIVAEQTDVVVAGAKKRARPVAKAAVVAKKK